MAERSFCTDESCPAPFQPSDGVDESSPLVEPPEDGSRLSNDSDQDGGVAHAQTDNSFMCKGEETECVI